MSLVPSQDRRSLLAVFIVLLIAFEMIAYVTTTPTLRAIGKPFFQLYVLGPNRSATDYYPNGNPDIRVGDEVRWYVGASNFMSSVQLISIRVRLGNQTTLPPDDRQGLPSSAPLVTEFKQFIQNDQTWELTFVWRISSGAIVGSSISILKLQINDEIYLLQGSSAVDGRGFRLIFELWTWDAESGAFQFGWQTGGERQVAWLQIWFDMTNPVVS